MTKRDITPEHPPFINLQPGHHHIPPLEEQQNLNTIHNTTTTTTTTTTNHSRPVPHRVPTIQVSRIVNPGVASGGGKPDGNFNTIKEKRRQIKDLAFRQYNNYGWSNLHLIASGLFAVATVLALLRMLPYVVVSDVIGPLQISLGHMVAQTSHFFVFIGVVFLAFAVGLTYIYSYYDEVNLQICVKENGADNCRSGKFAK